MNEQFWKQVSLSWVIIYAKEDYERTIATIDRYAAEAEKDLHKIPSALEMIMGFEEEDNGDWL